MKLTNGMKILALAIGAITLVSVTRVSAGGPNGMTSDSHGNYLSGQKQASADLSGKWDLDVRTDGGPVAAKAEFKVATNGTITGTIQSDQYGTSTISSGSVTDANFAIKFNISSEGSVIEVNMSGTFDAKAMKGTGTAADASFSFTGTRASNAKN